MRDFGFLGSIFKAFISGSINNIFIVPFCIGNSTQFTICPLEKSKGQSCMQKLKTCANIILLNYLHTNLTIILHVEDAVAATIFMSLFEM